jgi:hypothetical protein
VAIQQRNRRDKLTRDVPPEDDYGVDYEEDAYDDGEYVDPDDLQGASEPARTSRRRSRQAEDESPRRSRRQADSGDERPRFRPAADSDSKRPNRRRATSAREEAEKPSRGRSAPSKSPLGKGGFSGYKEAARKSSSGYDQFSVEEGVRKRKLIKFLQPEPITHFYQHWVPAGNGKNRPYVCLGESCPLCADGDRAKPVLLWNVVDMATGTVQVWVMSKDPAKKVEERYDEAEESGKTIDDFNTYYAVSKSKQANNFTAYKVDLVKRRDVEEDWDIAPLEKDEIEDLLEEAYDDSIVYIPSLSDLQAVADALED